MRTRTHVREGREYFAVADAPLQRRGKYFGVSIGQPAEETSVTMKQLHQTHIQGSTPPHIYNIHAYYHQVDVTSGWRPRGLMSVS